jgi:hypothetical protein
MGALSCARLGGRSVRKRACGTYSIHCTDGTMPRRGSRRITVIGVGTPPPLTLRALAMEILHRLGAPAGGRAGGEGAAGGLRLAQIIRAGSATSPLTAWMQVRSVPRLIALCEVTGMKFPGSSGQVAGMAHNDLS